jgi:peroxiredoxin
LQQNKNLFANFTGDIYALSADSVEKHKALKEELGLDFPVLSDKYLKVIEEAGLKEPGQPKSLRGFAIFNPNGELIESKQIDPFGDNVADIISYAAEKTAN